MRDMKYLEEKRRKVLEEIKPICKAFAITDYDYEIGGDMCTEVLRLNNTKINCSINSISTTIDEVIGYLFVNTFVKNRGLGDFRYQTLSYIKRYWIKGAGE